MFVTIVTHKGRWRQVGGLGLTGKEEVLGPNPGDLATLLRSAIPPEGPDLACALAFRRRLAHLLEELAAHVESHPGAQGLQAFWTDLSFGSRYGLEQWRDMLRRWGFDVVDGDDQDGLRGRLADFGHDLYAWVLIWAFNPASLRDELPRDLRRERLRMAREVLQRRYLNRRPACTG